MCVQTPDSVDMSGHSVLTVQPPSPRQLLLTVGEDFSSRRDDVQTPRHIENEVCVQGVLRQEMVKLARCVCIAIVIGYACACPLKYQSWMLELRPNVPCVDKILTMRIVPSNMQDPGSCVCNCCRDRCVRWAHVCVHFDDVWLQIPVIGKRYQVCAVLRWRRHQIPG